MTYNEFEDNTNDLDYSEDDLDFDYNNFNQAVIWGTDWTTETIAMQLNKGNIDLNPSFQRRDAWTDKEKSKLIESLMLGLPVPPIILAENKNKKNSYIVIDGKQRLLTIRRFYAENTDLDFKSKNLSEKDSFKELKIKGLEILKHINGYNRKRISENYNELICSLENQPIRTIIIKNWPDESFLYTVFLRLNTGSKRLSPQELRQALIPGPFLNYLDDATAVSQPIQRMLNNKSADTRMKDIELALRFLAYKLYLEDFKGNLKVFLDESCKRINENWEQVKPKIEELFTQLEESITFSYSLLENNSPFSRYTNSKCNNRFNRPIFELFTYYFSESQIRDNVKECSKQFVDDFIKLNDDADFISYISDTTKDIKKMAGRFEAFRELLSNIPSIKNSKIKLDCIKYENNKLIIEKQMESDV